MNQSDIHTLFAYNYWANARILDAAGKVTPEQYIAPAGLSFGSLRGALVHTYGSEFIWRMRCQEGVSPPGFSSQADFPTLDALRQAWAQEERAMRAFLATLSDERLGQTVKYTSTTGMGYETVLWNILAHLVNHGTQFRSEAAVALTAYGQSPGDLDLMLFFRQQKS
jgi:uncharacterized damage-inducible protein DinB